MARRIAMVGTASSGCGAPFEDTTVEIWGVSARAAYTTRADRWFELHRLDGEPPDWAASWRQELKSKSADFGELVMFYPEYDLAPKVTVYPYKHITDRFGSYHMSSTFSWMMALAIDEMRPPGCSTVPNGDEIMIYGVDMEYGTEYRQQRTGFRHFLSLAKELGIKVTRDVAGGLIYEPVPYPFWQDDPQICKLAKRHAETIGQMSMLNHSLESTRTLIAQNVALLEELDRMGVEYDREKRRATIQKELDGLLQTSEKLSKDVVAWNAIDGEQRYWRDYLQA